MANKKPSHRLKMLNKKTSETYTVGAGWKNEDNSITIVLNDCVTISQNRDITITLFPITNPYVER